MMTHAPNFRPLAKSDCDLVAQWRAAPHVVRWLGPCGTHDEVVASYLAYVTGAVPKRGYMALLKGRPIAFTESYGIEDRPQYFTNLGVTDPGSVGMDLFIGAPDDLGQGLGAHLIRRFVEDVLFTSSSVDGCYAAPDVANLRSIRAFEGAGFVRLREVQVPGDDAPAIVLRIAKSDVESHATA